MLENLTSHEEIAAYAEEVVKEVEAERASERSDSDVIASTSRETNNLADAPSGKTSAKVEIDEGEESGDSSEATSWLNDEVKAEAASYGISESELSDFESRQELDRALRLFDKTALEAGRKAMAASEGQSRNEKGQFEKKEEPKTEPNSGNRKEGRYEVALSKDLYDDEIVEEFSRLRDHYESRIERLESLFAEVSAKEEESYFDSLVDSLGFTELFGKTGKETEQELERRKDLLVAAKAQIIGLEQLGRPAEMNESLVSRVARMVFADELSKKELKQRTRKISRQSNSRLGGGATRPQDPSEDPREAAERLYRELAGH